MLFCFLDSDDESSDDDAPLSKKSKSPPSVSSHSEWSLYLISQNYFD